MQRGNAESRGPTVHADEPILEKSLYGPRRGFSGSLQADAELLQAELGSESFRFQEFQVGTRYPRRLFLVCPEDSAGTESLGVLAERIVRLKTTRVEGAGHLARLLRGDTWSPFPLFQATERPDRAVAALLGGKAAILLDGSPSVLIAPVSLFYFLHEPDDDNQNKLYGILLSFLRLLALAGAVFLPSIYVLITMYDYFLTPFAFIADLAASRLHVPLPPPLEMFLILVVVEALWEGAARLASPLSLLAGGVGGILAGATAAVLGFTSPFALLIGTTTLVTGLCLPVRDLGSAARLLRLGFLAMTAAFGLIGLTVSASLTFAHLVSLDSAGRPYVGPLPSLSRKTRTRTGDGGDKTGMGNGHGRS